jgi:NADH dehydrogenase
LSKRIAITGAGGFVGRHLALAGSSAGWDVIGVVRSDEGARRVTLAGGRAVRSSALEAEALAAAFDGARAVVHLAQIGAERDGATYESVNVAGTRGVLEAAKQAGVARVVFLSGLGVAHYGMKRRCTNRYFLSKLTAEVEIFRSGLEAVVFRPSFIVGPGGELLPALLRELASGVVERIGDGSYRLQPIGVRDAAAAILGGVEASGRHPAVYDLVGPQALSYREFVERVARAARLRGRAGVFRTRELPLEEAERQAAQGGYRGLLPDELDCLLCDEVADAGRLEALLGRFLTPVDDLIAAALQGS